MTPEQALSKVREVISNQETVHEDLLALVSKHKAHEFKRPIAEHTLLAFNETLDWLQNWEGDLVLDACCGVGESTLYLAKKYPNARIIGIDKSSARIDKHRHYALKGNIAKGSKEVRRKPQCKEQINDNYLILQADLNDFWRLLAQTINNTQVRPKWRLLKQYILYPNPYPKKSQVGKRWHASAVFPDIMASCKNIEVRSNWQLYLQEFALAAKQYGVDMSLSQIGIEPNFKAITPFERKYAHANQDLWMVCTFDNGCDK
jgi:tRNA G46 methylase TrmB